MINVYDRYIFLASDFGDRYYPMEARREIGYLQHIAFLPKPVKSDVEG